ncbi:hypothetical protein J5N97_008221 [Dioscorea zingiberensis]|uniref:Uncharacterized protein n=1 Tax=Dioscorea zingiberensis TaxID=325984 RepID=A0A9D5HUD8_9LILI|nr:hypothetical protein J5N97_008221 [Dioscorea zingiberensis]
MEIIEMENSGDPSSSITSFDATKTEKKKHQRGIEEKKSLEKRKDEDVGTGKRVAHPNCKHASNPYHSCGPYCSPSNGQYSNPHPAQSRDVNHALNTNVRRKEIAKGKAVVAEPGGTDDVKQLIVDKKNVNPNCKNASNPYHVCGSYCLSSVPKKGQIKGVTVGSNQTSGNVNMAGGNFNSNSNSNSKCKHASNPYHKCSEYCFKSPNHVQQPKRADKMDRRNGHSSIVDVPNPAKNQVKAIESNTREGDGQFMDNNRKSFSFHEQDLVEKVGILRESENDLGALEERDVHLKEIDSFDFNQQKKSAEENQKSDDEINALRQSSMNESNSYSSSAPDWLKKHPRSDHRYRNRKAISSPSATFHFGLLLISVLYYIAHIIITGGVFPERKTAAKIKFKESEDDRRESINASS